MLLPRRLLSTCPRAYVRVIIGGVLMTVLMCFLYKVNQNVDGGLIPDQLPDNAELIANRPDWMESALPRAAEVTGFNHHKRRLEKEIQKELAMQRPGLGDDGVPVHLRDEEAKRGKADLARIALNEELSKHLSYNRTAPDGRNPHCKRIKYDTSELPSAAVIIIFYDEALSVILRTVHSVLNTASENLKEIILVDDASTHEELQEKLEYYVATRLPKMVKLIRMKSR